VEGDQWKRLSAKKKTATAGEISEDTAGVKRGYGAIWEVFFPHPMGRSITDLINDARLGSFGSALAG
jgi:hypothetical protein